MAKGTNGRRSRDDAATVDAAEVAGKEKEEAEESSEASASPPPQEEEEEQEEDRDRELQLAARAGIRLLEENDQLVDEVRTLRVQVTRLEKEKLEWLRVEAEKDRTLALTKSHLRDAIIDAKNLGEELDLAKRRLVALEEEKLQRTAANHAHHSLHSLLVRTTSSPPTSGRGGGGLLKDDAFRLATKPHCQDRMARGFSPKQKFVMRLKEAETRLDEQLEQNSLLRMELKHARKRLQQLKPLDASLQEAKKETQMVQEQLKRTEKQLAIAQEERDEERELIKSLRKSLEVYQRLNDTMRVDMDERDSSHNNNNASEVDDGSVVETTDSERASQFQKRKSVWVLRDSDVESLDALEEDELEKQLRGIDKFKRLQVLLKLLGEQALSLKREHQQSIHPKDVFQDNGRLHSRHRLDSEANACIENNAEFAILNTAKASTQLGQRIIALEELVKRFKFEYLAISDECESLDRTNQSLLRELERLREELQEKEKANDSFDSLETEFCPASISTSTCTRLQGVGLSATAREECQSSLRAFLATWSTEKTKTMHLRDWLINSVRRTGLRKPLYLSQISPNAVIQFDEFLLPLLRQTLGLEVDLRKRLRQIIVTDLRLEVVATCKSDASRKVTSWLLELLGDDSQERVLQQSTSFCCKPLTIETASEPDKESIATHII